MLRSTGVMLLKKKTVSVGNYKYCFQSVETMCERGVMS